MTVATHPQDPRIIVTDDVMDAQKAATSGILKFRLKPQFDAAIISNDEFKNISLLLPDGYTSERTLLTQFSFGRVGRLVEEMSNWAGADRQKLHMEAPEHAVLQTIMERFGKAVSPVLGNAFGIELLPPRYQYFYADNTIHAGHTALAVVLPMGAGAKGIMWKTEEGGTLTSPSESLVAMGGQFEHGVDYQCTGGAPARFLLRAARGLV